MVARPFQPGVVAEPASSKSIGWGSLYFSVIILFTTLNYCINRGTAVDEAHGKIGGAKACSNCEWSAASLATALVIGLFIPQTDIRQYSIVYIAIVLSLGIAWYFVKRTTFEKEKATGTPIDGDPNLDRLGVYLGLLMGLGLSLRNGLKAWFNNYKGNEDYWSRVLWQYLGPVFLVCLIGIAAWILYRPLPREHREGIFRHAYGLFWLVLIAQLVTGPPTHWNEMAFSIYYKLLFVITATIGLHFRYTEVLHSPEQL